MCDSLKQFIQQIQFVRNKGRDKERRNKCHRRAATFDITSSDNKWFLPISSFASAFALVLVCSVSRCL